MFWMDQPLLWHAILKFDKHVLIKLIVTLGGLRYDGSVLDYAGMWFYLWLRIHRLIDEQVYLFSPWIKLLAQIPDSWWLIIMRFRIHDDYVQDTWWLFLFFKDREYTSIRPRINYTDEEESNFVFDTLLICQGSI